MREFLELLEKAIAVAPDKESADILDRLLFQYSQKDAESNDQSTLLGDIQ